MINRSRQQTMLIYVSKVKPHLHKHYATIFHNLTHKASPMFCSSLVTNTRRKEDAKTRKNAILRYKGVSRALRLFLRARAVINFVLRAASTLENTTSEQQTLHKFSVNFTRRFIRVRLVP